MQNTKQKEKSLIISESPQPVMSVLENDNHSVLYFQGAEPGRPEEFSQPGHRQDVKEQIESLRVKEQ